MRVPFKYIVENEIDSLWGLTISTVGYEEYKPGEEYPNKTHKNGYYFHPDKGRILQEYQLCYISEGEGFFESRSHPRCKVNGGTMFLLFPGEWHTYCPNQETGWKQYWIGFKGVNMDLRVHNNILRKNIPIFHVGVNNDIIHLYQQAINIALEEKAHFQLVLAGFANQLLGFMYYLDRNRCFNKNRTLVELINKAQVLMQEELDSPLSIQDLAHNLGMSYSLFRKNFKEYAGVSPAHYLQDIRLQRARELLRTTDLPVKEIAYNLHFESPDYFSTQFKKKIGLSPSKFRENI